MRSPVPEVPGSQPTCSGPCASIHRNVGVSSDGDEQKNQSNSNSDYQMSGANGFA